MTDRYVDPAIAASGTGGSWAQAYKTLKEATDAAAAGEPIYFHNGTADVITASTTYTIADGVRIISTSDKTNNPPTTYARGAAVSSTTAGVSILLYGSFSIDGVDFAVGTGTSDMEVRINSANNDDEHAIFYDCGFSSSGTTSAFSNMVIGYDGVNDQKHVFVKCSWTWGSTTQGIIAAQAVEFFGCDFALGGSSPDVLFEVLPRATFVRMVGCDLSDVGTVFEATPVTLFAELAQCKLKSGGTIFAPTSIGASEVFVYDCDSGDSHIKIAHYSYYGSTTVSTSVYANDNIADSNLSWIVAGSAGASKSQPYWSPWLPVNHAGTSAITPYLEVLRSGSTTSYLESEAWIEVTAKTTSGSTRSTFYSNRAGPLDTTTDNTDSAKGAGDWVGEDASNNWFGKLILNASITPAESGHICARVGVAGEYTLYVDPQIRGLA